MVMITGVRLRGIVLRLRCIQKAKKKNKRAGRIINVFSAKLRMIFWITNRPAGR